MQPDVTQLSHLSLHQLHCRAIGKHGNSTVIWNIGQFTILYLWRNSSTLLHSRNLLKLLFVSDQFNLYFVICIQGVKCWKVYLFDNLLNKLQNYKANKWGGLSRTCTDCLWLSSSPGFHLCWNAVTRWRVVSETKSLPISPSRESFSNRIFCLCTFCNYTAVSSLKKNEGKIASKHQIPSGFMCLSSN